MATLNKKMRQKKMTKRGSEYCDNFSKTIQSHENVINIKKRKLTIKDIINPFLIKINSNIPFDQNSNYLYSPYSIYSALTLAKSGSYGNTRKEFVDVLGDNNEKLSILTKEFLSSGTMGVAQSMFLQNVVPDQEVLNGTDCEFISTLFPAPGEELINRFVSTVTKGKISKIIGDNSTSELTCAVLVSAIYFKSDWKDEFDTKKSISNHAFSSFGKANTVSMMVKKRTYQSYAMHEKNGVQFSSCCLPYKDNNYSMVFIKPTKNTKEYYKTFEDKIINSNANFITDILNGHREVKLKLLKIPKFEIETEFTKLKEVLKKIGIKDAFMVDKADFGYLSKIEPIFISQVKHIAKIEVDEKGTIAVAASSCTLEMKGGGGAKPKYFILDHPFYCYVIFNPSKTIVFTAKVVTPTLSKKKLG